MPNAQRATKSAGPDAIALLTADHKEVKAMFKEFEAMKKRDSNDEEKVNWCNGSAPRSPSTPRSRKRFSIPRSVKPSTTWT